MGKINDRRVYLEVLVGYGGKCACCGESYLPFLSIDHVDGDGYKERVKGSRFTSNITLAYKIKRENFPRRFQVLCMNCNRAKGTSKSCPCNKGKTELTAQGALDLLPPRQPMGHKGITSVNAKLTDALVIEIRAKKEAGVKIKDLAKEYGVSVGCIGGVVYRKTWTHV